MFELIGALLYGLAIGAWWLIRMAWKVGKYLIPLTFIILGFFLGGSCANSCYGSLGDDYLSEKKVEYTHEVTIYWDDYETDYDVIKVREDLNWCINTQSTYLNSHDLFDDEDEYYLPTDLLPSKAYKSGYVFKGLFDASMGNGTQYITASGYSLMRVTEDIELYAYWEAVEN